ncbi:MAG: T9SS type A sorting domain-containing protein [Flavobacteriales bacterium]|nr:T9SS type A sorting domain-containing protein [Flavobacteriales bacterium]
MVFRTLLTVICLSSIILNASAQSLSVTDYESHVVGLPSDALLQTHGTVTNNSSAPIDVLVKFNSISSVPAGAGHYFCWAVCYAEGSVYDGFQAPANHSINIPSGGSVTNFYADYLPHNSVGVATFEYCFFDEYNTSDETCVQITFDTQNVGVEEVFAASGSAISESYPNPATKEAKINYSLRSDWKTAEITLYSMLGAKVRKVALKEKQGVLKMDVSTLPAGMYFYTLMVDDKSISTKKMLVTK